MNDMEHLKIKESRARRGINVSITVLLVLATVLCLYVVIQVLSQGYANLAGFSMFRVVTGSMEPTIPVGGLLVVRQVDMASIQAGDIICFRAQNASIFGEMMTHRVVGIHASAEGILFETKGDANLVLDSYFVTQTNFVGKVIWFTGEKGVLTSIFSFFNNKFGFLALIVFPCLLIGSLILRDCVKNIRNELKTAVDELENEPGSNDVLAEMTQDELDEMYERIRTELIEELMQGADKPKKQ